MDMRLYTKTKHLHTIARVALTSQVASTIIPEIKAINIEWPFINKPPIFQHTNTNTHTHIHIHIQCSDANVAKSANKAQTHTHLENCKPNKKCVK